MLLLLMCVRVCVGSSEAAGNVRRDVFSRFAVMEEEDEEEEKEAARENSACAHFFVLSRKSRDLFTYIVFCFVLT